MKNVLVVMCIALFAWRSAEGQSPLIKSQVFATVGHTIPADGFRPNNSGNIGAALRISLGQRGFVRPFLSAGFSRTQISTAPLTPIAQVGTMFGMKINARVSLAAGGGANILFPKAKPKVVLPTGTVAGGWKFTNHWSLFVPLSLNRRGKTVAAQSIYTF